MKMKFVITFFVLLTLLTGCQNSTQKNKEKYSSAINQVIELENKRISGDRIFMREDIGIIVYEEGKYIELMYKTESDNEIESLYEINPQKEYKYITKESLNKILKTEESAFKNISYTENVGLKWYLGLSFAVTITPSRI